MDDSTADRDEIESDDELEIGEIIRKDTPQRGSRPPPGEVHDYADNRRDRDIDRSTPVRRQSTNPLSGETSILDKVLPLIGKHGLLILVIIILFIASSFLYFNFSKLGSVDHDLTQRLEDLEGRVGELEHITQNLEDEVGEIVEVSIPETLLKSFDGIVALDNKSYSIGDIAEVTVRDTDINSDPEKEDVVNIFLININTNDQITITLTETGINTGEFTQKFTLARETGQTQIKVDTNDSIEVIYADKKSAKGSQEIRKATADIS